MTEQTITLTDDEREKIDRIVSWHARCYAENIYGGYLSAGVQNTIRAVERILAARVAAARADERARVLGEVDAPVALHAIRWEFDHGGVTATAVCNAPAEADCRLTSVSCGCEHWGEIQRRDDGTIWHHIVDYGDSFEPVWHEVKPMDDCNVCLFINESGCVEELGSGTFVIAETPIRPVWVDDGCDWERVTTPAPTHAAREDRAAMSIDPEPPGATLRPFTPAEAEALDLREQGGGR